MEKVRKSEQTKEKNYLKNQKSGEDKLGRNIYIGKSINITAYK